MLFPEIKVIGREQGSQGNMPGIETDFCVSGNHMGECLAHNCSYL